MIAKIRTASGLEIEINGTAQEVAAIVRAVGGANALEPQQAAPGQLGCVRCGCAAPRDHRRGFIRKLGEWWCDECRAIERRCPVCEKIKTSVEFGCDPHRCLACNRARMSRAN